MSLPGIPIKDMERLGWTKTIMYYLARLADAIKAIQSITLVFEIGDRALQSDATGRIAESTITSTELGYLNGVTSNVQTQLGAKVPYSGATGAVDLNDKDLTNVDDLDADRATFGAGADYAEFESDGTLELHGAATGWKDVFFPMAIPKATGVGNPTLTTWNTVFRNYSFAVNDVHDFDPQEFVHDGKEGSTATIHVHWVSMTNVGADRGVKWEVTYAQAAYDSDFPAGTTPTATEVTVPASTAVGHHYLTNLGTFTTLGPGSLMALRLQRIAAAGTAPANDPIVLGVHYHYEVDTPAGSRTISAK